MADCCICKKRMGMFEGNPLDSSNSNMSSYYVCGTCNSKIRGLKQKNPDVLKEFQDVIIPAVIDSKLKNYLSELHKTPEEKEAAEQIKEAEKRKQEEIIEKKMVAFNKIVSEGKNPVLLTTGYNFEKYEITQYKNIISGECVLGTGFISELGASLSDLTGTKSELFSVKLKDAKNHALFNLQKECYMIDANAIIGVDFDYVTFTNNMIGVIASGTAVTVEKLN
ncbi:MAG: heavy metal-binding domain-containing protein [Lachnospiraceae bacterium]|nr:heavy metal-binding domain-containing protein [Lachnospiraceae bacterium]